MTHLFRLLLASLLICGLFALPGGCKKNEDSPCDNCLEYEICNNGVCELPAGYKEFCINGQCLLTTRDIYWGIADCYGCNDTIMFTFFDNQYLPKEKFDFYFGPDGYPGFFKPGNYVIRENGDNSYLIYSFVPGCFGGEWLVGCKLFPQDSAQLEIVKVRDGEVVYPPDTCKVTLKYY